MPGFDRSHYTGGYAVRAKRVRDAAYADPATVCWRCGRTLAEEQARHPGRRVRWQAGHTVDGNSAYPLAAEHDTCNQAAGADVVNGKRRRAALNPSERWY